MCISNDQIHLTKEWSSIICMNSTPGSLRPSQDCSGVAGRFFMNTWQVTQFLTCCSISVSMFGHHINCLARDFFLNIPMWVSCSNSCTFDCAWSGTTTLLFHNNTSSWTPSSYFLFQKGLSSTGWPCNDNGQLQWAKCLTLHGTVEQDVSSLNLAADSGTMDRCSSNVITSGTTGTDSGWPSNGSLLSASAFPCKEQGNCKIILKLFFPVLGYLIVEWQLGSPRVLKATCNSQEN